MPRQWFETTTTWSKRTIGGERDRQIARIAARQRLLIRLDQLKEAGLSANAIANRARTGRLYRLHRGVFVLHPPPYDRFQLWLAALYACGPGSALSHRPAGALLSLLDDVPGPTDVTIPGQAGRKRDGIRVHRRALDPRDRTGKHGIPCTSAARTIVDLAAELAIDDLEDALIAADSLQILNRARLDELIADRRGRPGIRHLAALITDDPAELRNVNERRMFSICREFGVPRPLTNFRIETAGRTFYADFCWPELWLIVEADSWRWHGGRSANEDDRDRDQLLSIAGWHVVHFTRDQIVHARRQTGNRLVALTRSSGLRP